MTTTTVGVFVEKGARVEAIQFTGDNGTELDQWTGGLYRQLGDVLIRHCGDHTYYHYQVGSWVVRKGNGQHHFVLSPEDFERRFDAV